jgi:hypothetical protein
MCGLKLAIRVLCILAFLTGLIDMFAGVRLLIAGGGPSRERGERPRPE